MARKYLDGVDHDHMRQAFEDFIGQRCAEDDAGWSWEVFQHGYEAGIDELHKWMRVHAPLTYSAYTRRKN